MNQVRVREIESDGPSAPSSTQDVPSHFLNPKAVESQSCLRLELSLVS